MPPKTQQKGVICERLFTCRKNLYGVILMLKQLLKTAKCLKMSELCFHAVREHNIAQQKLRLLIFLIFS